MEKIFLSIIVPMYNVEKYIARCITSILNQMTSECELIIIDDCSEDKSMDVCKEIVSKFHEKNVYIIQRKENGGLSAARNNGIDQACGRFCWFIDSDDYISDGSVGRVILKLKNKDIDLLFFDYKRIQENGSILFESKSISENIIIKSKKEKILMIRYYLRNIWGYEVWRKIFSLEIIKKNHIYFESNKKIFAEDICFFLYYINYCRRVSVVNEVNYYYMVRSGSIMSKKNNKINEMINLAKMQNQYKNRILHFDYVFWVLPKLIELELFPLPVSSKQICDGIDDKQLIFSLYKNICTQIRKRIFMYGKKSTLCQILLLIYVKKEINDESTRFIKIILKCLEK